MVHECCVCNKFISGKPWMSVTTEINQIKHCCSYICSNDIRRMVGHNYLERIVNKEDFQHVTPVVYKKDPIIITDVERNQIKAEIEKEDQRIQMIEQLWHEENECSDNTSSDEEI